MSTYYTCQYVNIVYFIHILMFISYTIYTICINCKYNMTVELPLPSPSESGPLLRGGGIGCEAFEHESQKPIFPKK